MITKNISGQTGRLIDLIEKNRPGKGYVYFSHKDGIITYIKGEQQCNPLFNNIINCFI